ncbi:DUF4174 domain-containing protein [Microbulbifer sp. THAF38]|uniref:DUF4174 domain-containing protein n=1 Tax=Microbulbifer sp. THAF38 TaxID=2587856 RepID=UPI0012A87965|nr:DUF4174 domain-containing protein [Microbulbifer sp. THAF38]QFT54492.1 hypothetical protein FIU95_07995 [Microbulbifer sp. THAF38]
MRILFFLLFILHPLQLSAEEAAINNLKNFQWKYRVLLLANPKDVPETVQSLLKLEPQFAERQLLWFLFSDEKIETNYPGEISRDFGKNVRDQYFRSNTEQVILIGKDGGVKYRTVTFSPVEIFHRIDRMPMRQQEMQGTYLPSQDRINNCIEPAGTLNFFSRIAEKFCIEQPK